MLDGLRVFVVCRCSPEVSWRYFRTRACADRLLELGYHLQHSNCRVQPWCSEYDYAYCNALGLWFVLLISFVLLFLFLFLFLLPPWKEERRGRESVSQSSKALKLVAMDLVPLQWTLSIQLDQSSKVHYVWPYIWRTSVHTSREQE